MILTCPKCATSYTIDEAHLGADGRNVRCQACRATWFATRPPATPDEPIELVAAAPVPPAPPAREVKARELPRLYRKLMEDKKRLKALTQQGLIWGGMTLAFIAILGIGFAMRVDIVKAFPSTAKAFASVDPHIEDDAIGMRIVPGRQKMIASLKGGRFVVSVTTDVQNLKKEANPLAPMRVRLLDAHGNELSNNMISLKDTVLTPHGTSTVSFDVPDPKNLAISADLEFDLLAITGVKDRERLDKYYQAAAKRTASEGEHGDAHEAPAADHGGLRPAVGHDEAGAEAAAMTEAAAEPAHDEAPAMKPSVEAHH
jgi:predicted Zn finger-like uncharacterized protein